MPVDPFGPFTESLKMAIPLVLRQKAMQQEEKQFQAQMGQKRMEIEQEQEQERQKIAAENIKNQMTSGLEVLKRTVEIGDLEAAQRVADGVEKIGAQMGMPPLFPRDPATGRIQFKSKEKVDFPTRSEMEGEYALTGDPKILKNIQALEAATRSPKGVKTWVGPGGEIKNLREDQIPPAGYFPWSKPGSSLSEDRQAFRDERAMRKDFQALPEVKTHTEMTQQIGRAESAIATARAGKGSMNAIDQSLITILNKMLDPSSVVRESEYARTPEGMAVMNRLEGYFQRLQQGGAGLNMTERESIFNMAKQFYDVSSDAYKKQVSYWTDLSKEYGYNPEHIVRLGGGAGISKKESGKEDPLGIR